MSERQKKNLAQSSVRWLKIHLQLLLVTATRNHFIKFSSPKVTTVITNIHCPLGGPREQLKRDRFLKLHFTLHTFPLIFDLKVTIFCLVVATINTRVSRTNVTLFYCKKNICNNNKRRKKTPFFKRRTMKGSDVSFPDYTSWKQLLRLFFWRLFMSCSVSNCPVV